ncbi:MAG: tetratricopeptide repeat protein [Bryobacteraceae bacterium]
MREAGHEVAVETKAGLGSSITDREYMQAGADIAQGAEAVWRKADLIAKVKEPQPSGYRTGSLPLLTPMSEVAGRMSVQLGAQYLEAPMGGRGVLLGLRARRRARERGHPTVCASSTTSSTAIRKYQRALALDPQNAAAYNSLGSTLANQGRVAEAVAHFERALSNPNGANARRNLDQARLMLSQGR